MSGQFNQPVRSFHSVKPSRRLTGERSQRGLKKALVGAVMAAAVGAFGGFGSAATVNQITTDAAGFTSFTTGTHWSDGNVPSPANDYVDAGFTIRTPIVVGVISFPGNSLTIGNNAATGSIFTVKTLNNTTTTINNLTFNLGTLQNGGDTGGVAGTDFITSNLITIGAGGLTVDNGTTGRNFVILSSITGGGGLTEINSGSLRLDGSNSYTGLTTISSGTTFILNNANALGGGGIVTVNGTLAFGPADSGNHSSITISNSTLVTLSANGEVASFSGTIDNSNGGLAKVGNGILSLGGNNAYFGTTSINAGTLSLNSASALGATSTISFGGGTLQYTSNNTTDYSNLFLVSNQAYRVDTNGQTVTFATGLNDGTGSLTKLGAGTLTLTGQSSYSGTTTIAGGTLNVGFDTGVTNTNLASATSAVSLSGGKFQITGKNADTDAQTVAGVTVSAGDSGIAVVQNSATSINLTLGAISHVAGATVNFTLPTGNGTSGFINTTTGAASSLINDAGVAYATVGGNDWAAKDATNTFIVGGSSLAGFYTPTTSSAISGNADVGATDTTLTAAATAASMRFNDGTGARVINLGTNTLSVGGILLTPAVGANLTTISNGTLRSTTTTAGKDLQIIQNNSGTLAISANIANAAVGATALTKSGAATLVLSGSNTYTGTTIVNGGTLEISGGLTGTSGADIQLAPGLSSTAVLQVDAGATLNAQRVIIAGNSGNTTGGTATVNQFGGTINSNQWFTVGSEGSGIFNMTGGILNVDGSSGTNLEVGNFGTSSAIVNLSGTGAINILRNGSINLGANATTGDGTFNQTAGTVTFYSDGSVNGTGSLIGGTGGLHLGVAGIGRYTYNLNGGILTVPTISRTTGDGIFNFNGGTLRAALNTASFLSTLTAAQVRSGGAIIDNNGFVITVGQGLVHDPALGATLDGGLNLIGSGTTTLAGANQYTGPTTIGTSVIVNGNGSLNNSSGIALNSASAKLLQISTIPITPLVTLTNGTLDGTGTFSAVTVGDGTGGKINNGNGATTPLTITTLTFNGASTVNLRVGAPSAVAALATTTLNTGAAGKIITVNATTTAPLWAAGAYNLIGVTTLGGAGGMGDINVLPAGLGVRQTGAVTNAANFITLTVGGDYPLWTGLVSSDWTTNVITPDVSGNKNWKLNTAGTPTDYIQGDAVQFDDSAAGTTAITIGEAIVSPANMFFNNTTAKAYSISSAGGFGIAGVGALTKSNTGILTINTSNSYSGGTTLTGGTLVVNNASALGIGALTISGGTLDNTNGGVTLATINPENWTGSFTFAGTNSLNLGTGAVTLTGSRTVTVTANTLTVGGAIGDNAGGFSLTKAGAGTLVLGGANTASGTTTVAAGNLTLTGTINALNIQNAGQIVVGNTAAVNARLNISGGTLNATFNTVPSVAVGSVAGASGFINMSSGTINTNSEFHLGRGAGTGAFAAMTMGSGAVNTGSYFVVGLNNDRAVLNQSGGTINVLTNWMTIGAGNATSYGEANFSGTAIMNATTGGANNGMYVGEVGTGVLNISGSAVVNLVNTTAANSLIIGRTGAGSSGTVNLLGGTLSPSQVTKGAGSATINFNGGTLKARQNAGTFMTGLTGALIYGGGATIDDGGFAITIGQVLTSPAGNGVSAAGLAITGGAGYLDTPLVALSGGGGTGATANALVSPTGQVTGIVITNPGINYTSVPTFTLLGGGGTGASVAVGSAVVVPDVAGGLNKTGTGTLTLSGANLYTGGTTVSLGTLALTGNNNFGTGSITISGGTGTISGSNTYTGGTSLISGKLNINSAQALGSGALTISGGTLDSTTAGITVATNNAQNWNGSFTFAGTNNLNLGTGAVTLGTTPTITVNANTLTVGGAIGGSGLGIVKAGTGALTLTGASSYSGPTSVTAGRLALSGAGAINSSSGISINGGKLVQNSSVAVSPTVTLTAGTLDGTTTYNTVVVNDGTGAIVTNGDGGTGALSVGSLTFNGAGTINLNIASPTAPALNISTLTTGTTNATAGAITINLTNAAGFWTNGLYDLVSYSGAIGGPGGFGSFTLGTLASKDPRQIPTLGNSGGFITMNLIGDHPKWTGIVSGNWTTDVIPPDGSGNKNWKLATTGTATDFLPLDNVEFSDSATGTTTVNIFDANVAPSSVSFTNATLPYTIVSAGGFGISSGVLAKTGAGTVTINTSNTYGGGTTLSNGTLNLGNAAALGTGTLTITGGIFDNTGGFATMANNIPQNWNGSFTYNGTNSLNMGTGAVLLGASPTITVNSNTLTVGGAITQGTGVYGITKAGFGTLVLSGNSNFSGGFIINTGTVVAGNNNALGGTANALSFAPSSFTQLQVNGFNVNVGALSGDSSITISNNNSTTAGSLVVNATGANVYNGTFQDNGAAFGITLTGTGSLAVNGNNFYTGPTTVSGGTMTVNGSNHLPSATVLTANGTGTFDMTGFDETVGGLSGAGGGGTITSSSGTPTLTLNPATALTYTGHISGNITMIVNSFGGTQTLSGSSSYTGLTTVNSGATLLPANDNALGATTLGTLVQNGGQIQINTARTIAEPFMISGAGTAGDTGAINTGGNQSSTLTGPITLEADVTLKADGGSQMIVAGNVGFDTQGGTVTGANLNLRGDSGTAGPTSAISGVVALGTGGVIMNSGYWNLSGTNTYTGGVTFANLPAGGAAPILSISSDLALGPVPTVGNTTDSVVFQQSGTLQFATTGMTVAATRIIDLQTGTIVLDVPTGNTATFAGSIIGSAALQININHNGTPSGTLVLTGSSSYSGSVEVRGGSLIITSADALGVDGLGRTMTIDCSNQSQFNDSELHLNPALNGSPNIDISTSRIGSITASNTFGVIVNDSGNNSIESPFFTFTGGGGINLAVNGGTLTVNSTITSNLAVGTSAFRAVYLDGTGGANSYGIMSASAVINQPAGNSTSALVKIGAGTWVVNMPKGTTANNFTGGTISEGGALVFTDPGYVGAFTTNIPGGKLSINGSQSATYVGKVVVQGDSANIDLYRQQLLTSYTGTGGVLWSGAGTITAATATILPTTAGNVVPVGATAANHRGIGYATGSDYILLHGASAFNIGYTVNPSDVLLRFTYMGDATMDGQITVADYAQIDSAFLLGQPAKWVNGDFNYDGTINYLDYALIDASFIAQSGTLLASGEVDQHTAEFGAPYLAALAADLGPAAVPEPASIGILALGAVGLLRRRRR